MPPTYGPLSRCGLPLALVTTLSGAAIAQSPAASPPVSTPTASTPPAVAAPGLQTLGIIPLVNAKNQDKDRLSGIARDSQQLSLDANTSLNLVFGMNSRQADGLDLSLNGLRLRSQFGQSSRSKYSGLAYFSDTQHVNDITLSWRDTFNNPLKAKSPAAGSALLGGGYLLAQSLAMQSGGLRLSAEFQDVSKRFNGFAGLKLGAAGDKATLDQLAQLEKEKGLQRVGFGLGLGGSVTGKRPGGLSFDWGQIQDNSNSDKKPGQALITGANPLSKPNGSKLNSTAFASSTPSLHREILSLDTGVLNFSVAHRAIDSGFKRVGDLSDIEKNTYLLDVRRQFDTGAKIEQITQAERDQAGKTAAFAPDVTLARLMLGGSERNGVMTFGQYDIGSGKNLGKNTLEKNSGKNQGIARQILGFNSAHLQFSSSTQTILNSFTHLGELSDTDKTLFGKETGLKHDQMALQWQLDKTTKIGFERMQVAGSADAIRDAAALALKNSSDGKKDGTDPIAAQRAAASGTKSESFHLETKGLNLIANEAHTDKTFTRAADLALSDADKQQIERERGYDRKDLTLHMNAIKGLLLDSYTYKADNPIDKLRHDIGKNSLLLTPSKAISFNYGMDHDISTALGTKGELLRSGTSHTVMSFKGLLENNLQTNKTSNLLANKTGILLANKTTDALTKKPASPLTSKPAVLPTAEKKPSIAFTAQRDETITLDKGKRTQSATTDVVTVGTPKDKIGAGLDYSDKRIAFQNGKYDNTVEFNIHAKPTSNLSVQIDKHDIDRRLDEATTKLEDKKDGLVSTESIELDYKPIKNFDIILGGSQTTVPDASKISGVETAANAAGGDTKPGTKTVLGMTDSDSITVGLKGEPIRNLTLAAKFDEVHDDGKNTKDVADFSVGNAKPLQLGVFQDLSIKAGYASLNDKRLLQNETMTGHASWKMWKHEFLVDYGGFSKMEGKALAETVARTYSFKTDPSPQRWFHGSFFYKVRTLADGKDRLVRRFNVDVLVLKKTHLSYTYGILPENEKGEMQPTETLDVSLTHTLRPKTTLSLFYRINNKQPTLLGKPDPLAVTWTNSGGIGFEEPLGAKSKWSMALSRDSNGYGLFHDRSDHLRMSLDRQISSDNFLTLTTEYRTHDGKDTTGKTLHDEVRTSIDLSHKF